MLYPNKHALSKSMYGAHFHAYHRSCALTVTANSTASASRCTSPAGGKEEERSSGPGGGGWPGAAVRADVKKAVFVVANVGMGGAGMDVDQFDNDSIWRSKDDRHHGRQSPPPPCTCTCINPPHNTWSRNRTLALVQYVARGAPGHRHIIIIIITRVHRSHTRTYTDRVTSVAGYLRIRANATTLRGEYVQVCVRDPVGRTCSPMPTGSPTVGDTFTLSRDAQ